MDTKFNEQRYNPALSVKARAWGQMIWALEYGPTEAHNVWASVIYGPKAQSPKPMTASQKEDPFNLPRDANPQRKTDDQYKWNGGQGQQRETNVPYIILSVELNIP
ncbi:hypothetical protein CRG98_022740 [Punica granatum]|uniref:Uncharacterized protein n=1 Tax=Punica granatum TaxID=22663 RepID=A0A2I0JLR2_PUNGR|nr:hypothetical protein CRG98_022740 [Punica granatum]